MRNAETFRSVQLSGQRCVTPALVSPATFLYAVTGIILPIVVKSKNIGHGLTPFFAEAATQGRLIYTVFLFISAVCAVSLMGGG